MRTREKNIVSPFAYFISFLIISLTVLVVGGFLRVYELLTEYEMSTPENAVLHVINELKERNAEYFIKEGNLKISPLETSEDIFKSLGQIDEDKIVFELKEQNLYVIKEGCNPLVLVELKKIKQEGKRFEVFVPHSVQLLVKREKAVKVIVPENAQVIINGITMGKGSNVKVKHITEETFGIVESSPQQLLMDCYELKDLFSPPKIEVTAFDEKLHRREENGAIYFYSDYNGDRAGEIAEFAKKVSMAYANFISNDLKFDDIKGYFIPKTDTYSNLQSFYNGWYIEHDSFSFENLRVEKIMKYSPTHFSARIKFDYIIKRPYHSYSYPSDYTVNILKTSDGYKTAALIVN